MDVRPWNPQEGADQQPSHGSIGINNIRIKISSPASSSSASLAGSSSYSRGLITTLSPAGVRPRRCKNGGRYLCKCLLALAQTPASIPYTPQVPARYDALLLRLAHLANGIPILKVMLDAGPSGTGVAPAKLMGNL
ncbi:hypothetical protein BCR44DRAFT_1107284 [Catenaria anguillulae PL171]|uniref:Uncharacterized protein n=1 Tax=Catenaria anguillulae PL171 TaxID=765915 RepID=A0A1Y2HMG9_9FUNG|nr:hypothetical protein BCR44DRAFT_1107284 [Catenaria anguillulae PL171]